MRLLFWNNQKIPYPLAEKYPSYSPYCFVGNNPIKNVEIDGRYWIGTDGKMVTYHYEKGKIVLSSNAFADLVKYVNLLNKSGNKTAISQFKAIHRNQTKTHFVWDMENTGVTINGKKVELFGYHQPHDVKGKKLDWSIEKGKFDGDVAFRESGEYKEATITVFEKSMTPEAIADTIEYLFKKGYLSENYQNISKEDQIISTVSHEIEHDIDKVSRESIKLRQEGGTSDYDVERPAYNISDKVYDELD